MESVTLITRESGYEILHSGSKVYFGYRRTFAPAIASWIFSGLAFLMVIQSVIWAVVGLITEKENTPFFIACAILFALFVIFAMIASKVVRVYLKRKNMPFDNLENILEADLEGKWLLSKNKEPLCRLSELKVSYGMDFFDSTRGLMRMGKLNWKGGRAHIFKTNRGKEARRIVATLNELGIGHLPK